jgi:hypothetical protein
VPRSGNIILTTLLCAARFVEFTAWAFNVQRDPTIRIPQKLLNGLYVLTVILQQCAEGVAERVPTDAFVNAGLSTLK